MGKTGDSNSTCSVPECKSRSTNEITLYRYPKEEAQRKKWTEAIKIESKITPNMQVCSRHFVKSDYIISDNGGTKVKRLKKSAVPSQNLPWQFPNKRVSPGLAKARMERLKNRLSKVSDSPGAKTGTALKPETPIKRLEIAKKSESNQKPEVTEKTKKTESIKSEVVSEEDESTSVEPVVEKKEEIDENDEETDKNNEETAEGAEASEAKKDNTPARGPTRLRQREGTIKCEHCGRKCLTPQGLQTHQQLAHKNIRTSLMNPKKDSPVNNKAKSSPKPPTVPLISVKSPENLLAKPPVKSQPLSMSILEKVLQGDRDYLASNSEVSVKEEIVENQAHRKTEFECPLCKRRFAVYFMAYKHVQKHHSGTPNGSKSILPKPTRIEICTICNMTVEDDFHVCAGPLKQAVGLYCIGCEQEYKTLTLFDMHKSSMHSDGVQSMFFSTLDELEHWKQKMENQTRAKYSTLDQNEAKKTYRCTYRFGIAGNYNRQRMCPSSVVVQEFTKGFQVHYYPHHYGHDHQKYKLSSAFEQYSITSLMNLTAKSTLEESRANAPRTDFNKLRTELNTPDLYLQFQKITETIVNEAARINVNGLKKLMRKALDMMDIINNYVEDDDDEITSSNSVLKMDSDKDNLQDDVKLALANFKRKSDLSNEISPKRSKIFQSTENLKTPKNNRSFTIENKNVSPNQSKFIDTFQDFVGKSLAKKDDKTVKVSKKTPPVKTKIGQFKPKSPPKKVSFSPTNISPKKVKDIEYEVKEQENDCNILILKI
ncbi:uncharacterized protein LOC125239054 [Leguminivora glycinivorella]|uniref:uncharacterized protein LOC125239054 n=1 Tax=Leguminivora glycinivorella TaxID=1035111 RepID=UPI00200F3181|nr:uncharacterized protein LOC125239054 [Leguminivora glycinivorella]